uniref:C2H2-type domain-containing protein n=1 Tax=Strongyloides venezuelensis TaxID=75913 RepID=A0A0K0F5H2_STRVS
MKKIVCPFCTNNLMNYEKLKAHIRIHFHELDDGKEFQFHCKGTSSNNHCTHPPFNCIRSYLHHLVFSHHCEKK